ncbi:MAG: Smr/MutS family protein [Siculibacillus sp.]|nr:Smr/MutS family protein [Siculibacillus sp.]
MSSSLGRRRRALREEERRLWQMVAETVTPLDRGERRDDGPAAIPPPPPAAAPVADVVPPPASPATRPLPPPVPPDEPARPTHVPSKRALAGWARAAAHRTRETVADAVMVPRPPALAPIDDRTRRRLVRGAMAIDERLDLHGLTQEAAHAVLRRFLLAARDRGARVVLVITGKGKPGAAFEMHERGVLRRSVPHWLADPALRGVVVGFEEAHLAHGGAGAIYVRLRRRRDPDGDRSSREGKR